MPLDSVVQRTPASKRTSDCVGETEAEECNGEPKKKISFGLSKVKTSSNSVSSKKLNTGGISIKLGIGGQQKAAPTAPASSMLQMKPKVGSTAAAFNSDDEDEEEMPPECKMRMKNIGRETPTSAGPNSFGKSKMGFCDAKKMYEKQLRDYQDKE